MARSDVSAAGYADRRDAPRDEVFYRTRAASDRLGSVPVQIVDVSASGCMARTEADFAPGDLLTLKLPTIGEVRADIRWALGGRIGCRYERMLAMPAYLELLGALVKSAR